MSRTGREDTDSLELLVPLLARSVRSELAERQKGKYNIKHKCKHTTAIADATIIRRTYSHVPHNDISVNNGLHIRRWSNKIII